MTQEEKQVLLKDLCARLPYGVKIEISWWVVDAGYSMNTTLEPDHIEQLLNDEDGDTEIKPFLRPMSSMTKEEEEELRLLKNQLVDCDENNDEKFYRIINEIHNLYLSHHIDFMGLIPKNLAIEVTESNNPYKE